MKIINGQDVVMGRLASFVAKELLKGEEINVVNCNKVIISGNKKNIEEEFKEKRSKFGSSQKGPKHPRVSEKIVKRSIRGMLPNHRVGRGRIAWKNLRCYNELPKEFEGKNMVELEKPTKIKFVQVKHLQKNN